VVEDGKVTKWFEEPGRVDNCADDLYGASSPQHVLEHL
jgi:peroxiredoxin